MSRTNNELAYIAEITNLIPITGADFIELAVINQGWQVVVKKGEFKLNDLVCYCEIDSWMPHVIAPFLSKGKTPKEFNNIPGAKLRTVKLKGQLSQGLILSLAQIQYSEPPVIGTLLGGFLQLQKWEEPEIFVNGLPQGKFPDVVPKTDEERIQNLGLNLELWKQAQLTFEVTEKLHGTSCTILYNQGEFKVCSRNLAITEDESNTYWNIANKYQLKEKLTKQAKNLALQGEIIGPKILDNQYGLNAPEFYVFNVYDIDKQQYLTPIERIEVLKGLGLNSVPVIYPVHRLNEHTTLQNLLDLAEGPSILNGSVREGLVFKCRTDSSIHFKVVANNWLLKN